jgi:hypothetical protein
MVSMQRLRDLPLTFDIMADGWDFWMFKIEQGERGARSACENQSKAMIPIRDLFETHLTVGDLPRAMAFYGDVLGLEIARLFPERKIASYWIGGRGNSMLGLWEAQARSKPQNLHSASRVSTAEPRSLRWGS